MLEKDGTCMRVSDGRAPTAVPRPYGKVGSGPTLYGIRHTVAVILREIGYDERTIADALGQKTIEMARHSAKGAKPAKTKAALNPQNSGGSGGGTRTPDTGIMIPLL